MAPEYPPKLVVFDSRFEDEQLKGDLYYAEVSFGSLRVRWDAKRRPTGFRSVGGGVAFVENTDQLKVLPVSHDSIADDLGSLHYRWSRGLPEDVPWMMFVVILPPTYTVAAAEPRPTRAKVFKDRLALYWILEGKGKPLRTQVECALTQFQGDASSKVVELNRFCSGGNPPTTSLIEIEESPRSIAKPVFISYANEDNENPDRNQRWLERLRTHLRPLEFEQQLTVYSDRDIALGDDWHEQIQTHLEGARVAVLLISSNFMGSEYIRNSELPVLLRRAKEQGTKILPVLLSPSRFDKAKFKYPDPKKGPQEFTLSSLQAAGLPDRTLVEMDYGEQERVLLAVANRVEQIVQGPSPNLKVDSSEFHGSGPQVSATDRNRKSIGPEDYDDRIVSRVAIDLNTTRPLTIRILVRELNELFNRGTFRFEPLRECVTQEWGARLHAAMQTLELLRLYSAFVTESAPASDARIYEKLMDEVNGYCQMMAIHLFEQSVGTSALRDAVGTHEFSTRLPPGKKLAAPIDPNLEATVDGPRIRAIKQMDKLRNKYLDGRKSEKESSEIKQASAEGSGRQGGSYLSTHIPFDWVTIRAGYFPMGSAKEQDRDAEANEKPQHKLHLPEYRIARSPVTVAQFRQFIIAAPRAYKTTAEREGQAADLRDTDWQSTPGAYWKHPHGPDSDVQEDHPVTCISWNDAVEFCKWARVRLPSEAEWEKAAGWDPEANVKRIYPWGNEPPDKKRCNFDMQIGDTTPVGHFPLGANGLYDMAGNVWEWTNTLYKAYPYEPDDRENPEVAGERVLRGGSFYQRAAFVRCAFRNKHTPNATVSDFGFRVCAVRDE
jgi:formylglycine-generating enzyme